MAQVHKQINDNGTVKDVAIKIFETKHKKEYLTINRRYNALAFSGLL